MSVCHDVIICPKNTRLSITDGETAKKPAWRCQSPARGDGFKDFTGFVRGITDISTVNTVEIRVASGTFHHLRSHRVVFVLERGRARPTTSVFVLVRGIWRGYGTVWGGQRWVGGRGGGGRKGGGWWNIREQSWQWEGVKWIWLSHLLSKCGNWSRWGLRPLHVHWTKHMGLCNDGSSHLRANSVNIRHVR